MRLLLTTALLMLAGCGASSTPPGDEPLRERPPIVQVIQQHAERLLAIEGVNMMYESLGSDGQPCIHVGVVELTAELRALLPRELEGWPVVVIEAGEIRPLSP